MDFTGPSGGLWNRAANWTSATVPAAADTATIAHTAARTVRVNDANHYTIHLTNGGGSGTSSTGALLINSTTFDIDPGGKLTLDGWYFHNPGSPAAVRTVTKSVGNTGGSGTLELTGDCTLTFLRCSLSAGNPLLNGTGTDARLLGLGSIGANAALVIGSSNTNLISGTTIGPATHGNTGIRLISGLVDLNGNNR